MKQAALNHGMDEQSLDSFSIEVFQKVYRNERRAGNGCTGLDVDKSLQALANQNGVGDYIKHAYAEGLEVRQVVSLIRKNLPLRIRF